VGDVYHLIWLFEDQPASDCGEAWPVGLHSFRLRRGDREVLFSLDPMAGEAYVTLYVAGQEIMSLGRLRRIETLTIEIRDEYEGLALNFEGARFEPVRLQTKPTIRLTWNVLPVGTW
jgi:hypothetical protein